MVVSTSSSALAGDDGYVFDNSAERVVGEVAGGGNDTIWTFVSVDLRDNPFVENLRLQARMPSTASAPTAQT